MSNRWMPFCFSFPLLFSGFAQVMGQTGSVPPELVLRAKVRDFKEKNFVDTVGTHPHFNGFSGCSAKTLGVNTVQAEIDVTGPADGGAFPGDNRTPKLVDSLGDMAHCYEPPERFSDWFADKGPDINRGFLADLHFNWDEAEGVYRFKDSLFFPIDSGKSFVKFNPEDPDSFGPLHFDSVSGIVMAEHVYGFTLELHTEFRYDEGKGQVFTFAGDDDIWVFLNGKRVIDLGGLHAVESGEANLDTLKEELGLENGKVYPMDFFFAERGIPNSSCVITTNLTLISSIPVVEAPVASPGAGQVTTLPAQVALSSATEDAKIYYTLDGSEPDSTKTLYASPLEIGPSVVLKAKAYKADWIASAVMVETYPEATVPVHPGLAMTAHPGATRAYAVFDRAGRLVRRMRSEARSLRAPDWDRRDLHGRAAAPGVYFWRAEASASGAPATTGMVVVP